MIPVHTCMLRCVQLFVTLWTTAHQAPLLMGFSRQAYQSALSFPTPQALPSAGMELASVMSPPLTGGFFNTSTHKSMVPVGEERGKKNLSSTLLDSFAPANYIDKSQINRGKFTNLSMY